MRVIEFDRRAVKIITDGIARPIKNSKGFFKMLGVLINKDISIIFKNEGALPGSGFHKWRAFSPNTLKTAKGTWKIRYGTDMKGRPKGTYTPGVLRKGIRRYSARSKLLQASGSFRKTFGILWLSKNRLKVGTVHKLAKDIMSNPTRNVIKMNNRVLKRYRDLFYRWVDQGIKF